MKFLIVILSISFIFILFVILYKHLYALRFNFRFTEWWHLSKTSSIYRKIWPTLRHLNKQDRRNFILLLDALVKKILNESNNDTQNIINIYISNIVNRFNTLESLSAEIKLVEVLALKLVNCKINWNSIHIDWNSLISEALSYYHKGIKFLAKVIPEKGHTESYGIQDSGGVSYVQEEYIIDSHEKIELIPESAV